MRGEEIQGNLFDLPLSYFFQAEQTKTDKPYTSGYSEILLFEFMESVEVDDTSTKILFSKPVLDAAYNSQSNLNLQDEIVELFKRVPKQSFQEYSTSLKEDTGWVKDENGHIIGCILSNTLVNELKDSRYSIRPNTLAESISIRAFGVPLCNMTYQTKELFNFNVRLQHEIAKLTVQEISDLQNEFTHWKLKPWTLKRNYKTSKDYQKDESDKHMKKNEELQNFLNESDLGECLKKIRLPRYGYLGWIFSAVQMVKLKRGDFPKEIIHSGTFDVVNKERILEFNSPELAAYAIQFLTDHLAVEIASTTFKPNEIQNNIAKLFLEQFEIVMRGGGNVGEHYDANLESSTLSIPTDRFDEVIECLVINDFYESYKKHTTQSKSSETASPSINQPLDNTLEVAMTSLSVTDIKKTEQPSSGSSQVAYPLNSLTALTVMNVLVTNAQENQKPTTPSSSSSMMDID